MTDSSVLGSDNFGGGIFMVVQILQQSFVTHLNCCIVLQNLSCILLHERFHIYDCVRILPNSYSVP